MHRVTAYRCHPVTGLGGVDPHGSGLAGLRERAEAVGGMLRLTSPPGRGTSLHVRLPAVAR
jgi:signal transduction histidine kinase